MASSVRIWSSIESSPGDEAGAGEPFAPLFRDSNKSMFISILKSGGESCANARRVSPHTNVVPINTSAATLRRSFMVPVIPGPQLVQMLDHVIVLEQVEMLDDVIVGQQADIGAAQLLLQLELIDFRRGRAGRPAMHDDRDREYGDGGSAHRHRRPAKHRPSRAHAPATFPGIAQLAPELGAIRSPIR